MFVHIRKHQKWLFILIIAVVVIAFVIFFTPSIQYDSFGASRRSDPIGSIDGRPITRKSFIHARKEVSLQFFLLTGQWPDQGNRSRFDVDQETPNRLLLLDKVREHGIQISGRAAARWIVSRYEDANARNFIITNELARIQMAAEDFQSFAKNQIAIGQLVALAGMSGEFVSPREADLLYREESLEANVQAVFFSSTDYADLSQDLTGLETFYTNRMALYRTPAKRSIRYVKFASTNYLSQAQNQLNTTTNLMEMARAIYAEKGTNAFMENGIVLTEEAAIERIKKDELEKIGFDLAKQKASEFSEALSDIEPMQAESLNTLAEEKGYLVEVSESFSENQLIPKLGVPFTLTRQVYQLSDEEPFNDPFFTSDAIYIIALGEIIPSAIPPLDTIRSRVSIDFYREKSLEAARNAAKTFRETLLSQMAEGRHFEEICDEAGLARESLPLFSRNTQTYAGDPRADLGTLQGIAFGLGVGEISESTSIRDGAMILFVNNFVEVLDEDVKQKLPDYIESLRQNRRAEAFGEWFAQAAATMIFSTGNSSQDNLEN